MEAQRVRAQLERILSSAAFAGSERASRFLRLVVERTLRGDAAGLKEVVIAVEAFKRDVSFDPKADPIVRVEAGRLRDRLRSYYDGEGKADAVLIELPKGSYAPRFSERRTVPRADVLRLSIVLPGDSPADSFAVSPDGRLLAFTSMLAGKQLLSVRPLDALESRILAGTEGATYPFWSPDSRSVAFFAQTKLKRVDFSGGPPRELADVLVGRGGAWSESGTIVFCPRPLGPLYQVSEHGGVATPVTTLDVERAEAVHGFPQVLPGGQRFLYLAMSARAELSAIRLARFDSSESKLLVQAETSALYAHALPGMRSAVVYVSGGALLAQRIDLERLELEGEPIRLAENVRHRRWYQAQVSVADNGTLVYQQGSSEQHRFAWVDRSGARTELIGPTNDAISFNLSPDERYVAFYRDSDPATVYPKIWAMDLRRAGAMFRVTDSETPAGDFTPVWSANGDELLYSRGDDRGMQLVRQPLVSAKAACVLDSPGPKFPTDWSDDGRVVAYTSQAPDFRWLHVWTAEVDAEPPGSTRPLLNHGYSEANACFAPGAAGQPRFMAYTSSETGRDDVYVCDFPRATRKWQVSSNGGLMPHWRQDVRELFYLALDGTLMAAPIALGSAVEVGAPRALFATGIQFVPQHKAWMNQYAVARDGQRFLVNQLLPEAADRELTIVVPR